MKGGPVGSAPDGKYVLRTNSDIDTDQVALAYKDLWRVERAFRDLKTTLDLRPVYHWKETRVRGHIMVCFLALVLESALQRKLAQKKINVKYTYLLRDLQQLRAVELSLGDEIYLCRTELVGDAYQAFRALGIRPPLQVAAMAGNVVTKTTNKNPEPFQLTFF